jgi:hypothetical protein
MTIISARPNQKKVITCYIKNDKVIIRTIYKNKKGDIN